MLTLERTANGHYQVEFKPVKFPPFNKEGHDIVQKFAGLLEETIRKSPADYLWSHKRWKYDQKKEREVLEASK